MSKRRQSGFTIIELMIAITLGLIILAALGQVFASQRAAYRTEQAMSRLQENARFALMRIVEITSKGGHMGCISSTTDMVNTLSLANQAAFDFAAAIDGSDDDGVGPNGEDWDTLIVRSAGASITAPPLAVIAPPDVSLGGTAPVMLDSAAPGYSELQQFDIFALSDCTTSAVFMITNDPGTSGGSLEHAAGVVAAGHPTTADGMTNTTNDLQHQFGALNASVVTGTAITSSVFTIENNGDGIPSLFLNGTEVVEGISGMQIVYGEDLAPLDLTADRYVDAATIDAGGDWNNVTSVRITLTVSSVQNVDGTAGDMTKDITATVKLRGRGV